MPFFARNTVIQVRRLSKTATVLDARLREPASEPVYVPPLGTAPEQIKAQIRFKKAGERYRQVAGNVPDTVGRIMQDLTRVAEFGQPLAAGDLIVGTRRLDGTFEACDYVVTATAHRGHLSDPTLHRVSFEDNDRNVSADDRRRADYR